MQTLSLNCPKCGNKKVFNNGHRLRNDGSRVQRLKCPSCGCSFSENNIRVSWTTNKRHVSANKAKNMADLTELKTVKVDTESKLQEYHLTMKINGYSDATINLSWGILEVLKKRGAVLEEPKSVKKVISEQNWSGNRKRNVINAYSQFLKYLGLQWEQPIFNVVRKIPFIPTEQEVNDLIAGMPSEVATYCQLLVETAMRSGEAIKIQWKNVDLQRHLTNLQQPRKEQQPKNVQQS